jgi:uncharacterized protein YceH (UPF0502 family)
MDKLTPYEGRVLGVIIEKEMVLPSRYPLTLHSIHSGCNQKTCRQPVYVMLPHEVLTALNTLKEKGLITSSKGRFVEHYSHQVQKAFKLPSQAIPVLCVLLLRGPLTSGEILMAAENFIVARDKETVEGYLRMMSRDMDPPLVEKLPLTNGERLQRWSELLTNLRGRSIEGNRITLEGLGEQVDFLQDKILDLEIQIAELIAKTP